MADFKTHVVGGIVVGAIAATVATQMFHMGATATIAVFIMGVTGGLLPDLDSDSGKPLALLFGAISILIPALMLGKVPLAGKHSPELLVSYFVISYLVINVVICNFIKKLTRHRGIFHSIPFAVLAGELGYLLFLPSGHDLALIIALSLFCGCLIHLLLDELNSLTFTFFIIPRFKSSFGTAMKVLSDSVVTNIVMYGLLFYVTYRIVTL